VVRGNRGSDFVVSARTVKHLGRRVKIPSNDDVLVHFHMSTGILDVGLVLHGSGREKVASAVEEALESRRPTDKISRLHAVFSAATPDFRFLGIKGGYIHRVRVLQPRQMHDAYWVGKLQSSDLKRRAGMNQSLYLAWTPGLLDYLCEKYWTGGASPRPVWECLSAEAAVEEVVSRDYVFAKDTAADWRPSS
jgi:hypothetical protein